MSAVTSTCTIPVLVVFHPTPFFRLEQLLVPFAYECCNCRVCYLTLYTRWSQKPLRVHFIIKITFLYNTILSKRLIVHTAVINVVIVICYAANEQTLYK